MSNSNPILLQNNITQEVICKETFMAKKVFDSLQALGYDKEFCQQAAAIYEWLNTINLDDINTIKSILRLNQTI